MFQLRNLGAMIGGLFRRPGVDDPCPRCETPLELRTNVFDGYRLTTYRGVPPSTHYIHVSHVACPNSECNYRSSLPKS